MEMSNDKIQMTNQIPMTQCQKLFFAVLLWHLDFGIHLNFEL
jgi:hypothetical protein